MRVPTIEELVETFLREGGRDPGEAKRAMLAVLDRLKPVVSNAHFEGQTHADFNGAVRADPSDAYATRIIEQIKGA